MKRLKPAWERAGAIFVSAALCSLLLAPGLAAAADAAQPSAKDETVRVYTSADGTTTKTEVETVLKNAEGAQQLADATTLTAIEVDDEGQTRSGEGASLVWNAAGKDVSYTGASSDAAPVSISVTYALDGRQIAPDQLAGKSGEVTIRFDYVNASTASATVNGASERVYTPFTCITALMLDGKSFKNVKVENAKVIEDGDDIIVAGYAMPGLKESLGSLADDANIPEHFQVTADVTDFELNPSMTIVTAGLMSDLDAGELGMSNLDDASALTDAMGQLVSGSDTLANGLGKLAEGADGLAAGMGSLASGADSVSSGLYILANGDGSNPGLKDSGALVANLAKGLEEAGSQAAMFAEKSLPEMKDALNGAIAPESENAAALELLESHKDALGDDYEKLVGFVNATRERSALVSNVTAELDKSIESVSGLSEGLAESATSAMALSAGLDEAATAAQTLYYGSVALEEGAEQLQAASSQLKEGVNSAAEGSQALTDGMRTFNDEGVAKLVGTLRNDYGGLLDRVNALSSAAKSYDNFAGKVPDTPSSVKFVFETDGIAE